MVMDRTSTELNLPSEYESAVANIYRFLNLGWLMISLYVAISLVYFSGAQYRDVIPYAIGAPLAFLSTSWIKYKPWDQIRLLPVIFYTYFLPFAVDEYATSPWYSIGLIATCAAMSATMLVNRINSVAFILLCVLAQYFVALKDLKGISDSKDTILLNGYFSSIWVLVAGLTVLVIIRKFYKYCIDLDNSLEEVEVEYWERSQKISRLNLKDYINLKLHGTILNTLIVAQKMSGLTSKEAISQQLQADLRDLETEQIDFASSLNLTQLVRKKIDFGRLQVEINQTINSTLLPDSTEFIIELIREVTLNIIKHTNSRKILINISSTSKNDIQITINEELSSISSNRDLNEKAVSAMKSRSMQRLCKETGSQYSVSSFSTGSLLHRIKINLVDRDLGILTKTKTIRRKSLDSFVNNISSISILFTLFAFPGFIVQKVPAPMILIVLICSMIHLYLLRQGQSDVFLVSLLVALPLALIPYAYTTRDVCTNLEVLPWIVNSLLGAFLYGSFSSPNALLRWIPGLVIFAECLSANYFLPSECSSLLNGTTPGIAIALILARSLMSRRSRDAKQDSALEALLRNQSELNLDVQEKVTTARNKVLSKVRDLSESQSLEKHSPAEIGKLVNLIRAYLLCSEKFEREFFQDMFEWVLERYQQGLRTSIELYEVTDFSGTFDYDFKSNFKILREIYKDQDLSLNLTISHELSVELKSNQELSNEYLEELNALNSKVTFNNLIV